MKNFEFIDITTSDVAFKAYGKDLSELFANAAIALFEVIVNTKKVEPKIVEHVILKDADLKALMFDWLNHLIYFVDAKSLVFSKFDIKVREKDFHLEGDILGEEIEQTKHEPRTHVKACTYHKMEIKKTPEGWAAQVILDI